MATTTLAPARSAPADTPLSAAYTRLAELLPALRVQELRGGRSLPEGDGWVTTEQLAEGGGVTDSFLSWDDQQILRDYGQRGRPDVVASFGLHRYAWPATLLITFPWYLHRRVPRLPAGTVAFHREAGRLAVRTGPFACLPDDPAAAAPGARVVADEEALAEEVRSAVAEHLAPVLDGFRPRMRRRPRALWGVASDEIVEGLWYVGRLLGEERHAMAEAERLLPGATGPFPSGAGFRELHAPDGTAHPTRTRANCCLFYTLRPREACVTCPRTCDSERIARLTEQS
ncbi:iron-sulfur protein [Streptomyces durbertensis]|uniref:Iron-sulfur protein n=1 Tax=Streptomyces durbertensis TaxID=2448886 RepID=A0ABR6EEZ5_9ACTN|nr:(2Fe-2S)-binding protein [Streptomyces durbertensis]MBB1243540.1 iron-sulfur protein [Streptomyces durbertensis]